MLFFRTTDETKIQGINEEITFKTHAIKGNKIIQPNLSKSNSIEFNESILTAKMIPKDEKDNFNNYEIKMIKTDNTELIYQDPNNTCHFLVLDEDSGMIVPTKFEDLTEDDEILLYDPPDDYILSGVNDL
jgi:hypothetical protein